MMDDIVQLHKIQEELAELGFECNFLPKSETGSQDMILVKFDNDKEELESLIISIMPLSRELEGSYFIQFYYEYPFAVKTPCPSELKTLINNTNRQLPLGHFNTNLAWSQIYLKYILAQTKGSAIKSVQLGDIMDILLFTIQHFEKDFLAFKME